MHASRQSFLTENRWAYAAIIIGFLVGFLSAYLCIIWHLVIFGFNIMYIVSPLLAGVVETVIARRKYGRTTGAISALLTFIFINVYGWLLPGTLVDPTKEPATLSFITIIALGLMFEAAFPTLVHYILLVVVVGTIKRIVEFLVFFPSRIGVKRPKQVEEEIIAGPSPDEVFLDGLTVPLSSVPPIDRAKIKKHLGLVTGSAVAEQKQAKGRLSKLAKMIQPMQLDDVNLGKARKAALSQMLEDAESRGATRVIDVLFDYVSMSGFGGSAIIVTAAGTAVIYEAEG